MTNQDQQTNPQSRKRRSLFYLVLIGILLVVNAILFYTNLQTRSDKEVVEAERSELLIQTATYERKVDSLKGELTASLGINAELDSIIYVKVRELDSLKHTFGRRIAARDTEIGKLKRELDEKIKEIERKTRQYTEDINDWKRRYTELETEKEALVEEVAVKVDEIRTLETTVEKGAILTATEIRAAGIQTRGETKEKETDRAKRSDFLRVCFKLAENRIAKVGYKEVFIKISGPDGTTLAVQALGSGTFHLTETGESSLYTKKITVDYDPGTPDKTYCVDWQQDNEFPPGTYNVELFQSGFLIGKTSLELRKGGIF